MHEKAEGGSDTSSNDEVIDASGCYAIPGLVDIHFHGAMGYDVCDGNIEAFEKIAKYEAERGIAAICPATLTLPVESLKKVLSLGAEFTHAKHKGHIQFYLLDFRHYILFLHMLHILVLLLLLFDNDLTTILNIDALSRLLNTLTIQVIPTLSTIQVNRTDILNIRSAVSKIAVQHFRSIC